MSHTFFAVVAGGWLLLACASTEDASPRQQRVPFAVTSVREPLFAPDSVREPTTQTRERSKAPVELHAYTPPVAPRPPSTPPSPRPPGPRGPGPK